MRLDHVIHGTRDLEETAGRLEREHGLRFRRGGRHPGGTVNWVAPIEPPQYVELLAVERAEDDEARHLQSLIESGRALLGWGISVDDIDPVAERLGCEVGRGSITQEDGTTGSWRFAYDPDDDAMPFFIQYEADPEVRLGGWRERVREVGNDGFGGFTFVEVSGDEARIRAVLGTADIPVRFAGGRPGLKAVGIAGPAGEVVLRDAP